MADELPTVVTTIADVLAAVAAARVAGHRVGLVPTMGALHEGHAALVRAARRVSGFVVVSIFVNPTQFGPNEDFARIPADARRRPEAVRRGRGRPDLRPDASTEMYPPGSVTFVEVAELGDDLCGASRPGHFRGVCTVVLKLFNIVRPGRGLLRREGRPAGPDHPQMVRDLNVPVEVRVEPTVREPDGLALSSRNRYLAPEQRAVAPRIYQALRAAAGAGARRRARRGRGWKPALHAELAAIPGARVDYAEHRGRRDAPAARPARPARRWPPSPCSSAPRG